MKTTKKICPGMDEKLADLLLDPAVVPADVRAHVADCAECSNELAELRATMEVLDTWQAEEPSPWFLARLEARLREERAAEPVGWLARLSARFVYGPSAHVRPLAAMSLTVLLLVGGGAYLGVVDPDQATNPTEPHAAVVQDLQTMQSNAQILDQLESLTASNEGEN